MSNSITEILNRVKKILSTDIDSDVAKSIGISVNALSNRKRSGSVPYSEFVQLAKNKNVNLDWLIHGSGPIYKEKNSKSEKQTQSGTDNVQAAGGAIQGKITDLITKTIEILESNTVYSGALSANIDAFHEATRTEKQLRDLKISVEQRFTLVDQRMAVLEAENKRLKVLLDDSSDNGESLASGQN